MNHGLENVGVQQAEPADCLSIRQLALDANIDAWLEGDYSEEISRQGSFVLKALFENKFVGFLVARIVPGANERNPDADLYNIGVSPGLKRQGIGTLLLFTLVERLADESVQNLWLEVRESNSEAISFYERHGFKAEVTRPNFYSNPSENAVIMRLQIRRGGDVPEG